LSFSATSDIARIVSNYARLLTGLLLGLILVPILLGWLGNVGYGLYSVLYISVGLAVIFEEITRSSLIRELGSAYHEPGKPKFGVVYNSSILLSLSVAALALVAFTAVYFAVPLLNIDPQLHRAGRVMVLAEGTLTLLYIIAAPAINMYVITFRFLLDNLFLVLRRSTYLIGALICRDILHYPSPIKGDAVDMHALSVAFEAFTLSSNLIGLCVLVASVTVILQLEPTTRPRLSLASRSALKQIYATFGWNTAVNIALNMYDRVGGIIINLAFGTVGNVVWGLAIQLAAYVRMISLGVNSGVDAIAAKISSGDENERKRLVWFVRYSTVLHSLVAFPAAVAIGMLTEPMLRLWVGRKVQNPDQIIPLAVTMTQFLLVPIAARSVSDAWLRILYGSGHVHRYAPMVLIAGVVNAIIAALLVFVVPLPSEWRIFAPAATYAVVYTATHFFMLPYLNGKYIGISGNDMVGPTIRPLLVSLMGVPLFIIANKVLAPWSLTDLAAAMLAYGVLYLPALWFIALTGAQRQAIISVLRKRGTKSEMENPVSSSTEF